MPVCFFAHPNEIQLDLASLISSNWKHITLMYKVEKRMHLKNLRYLEWYLGDCADHPAWTMAKECFLHRGLGYDEDREADCGWLWPSSCCAWLCSNDFILNISGPYKIRAGIMLRYLIGIWTTKSFGLTIKCQVQIVVQIFSACQIKVNPDAWGISPFF